MLHFSKFIMFDCCSKVKKEKEKRSHLLLWQTRSVNSSSDVQETVQDASQWQHLLESFATRWRRAIWRNARGYFVDLGKLRQMFFLMGNKSVHAYWPRVDGCSGSTCCWEATELMRPDVGTFSVWSWGISWCPPDSPVGQAGRKHCKVPVI